MRCLENTTKLLTRSLQNQKSQKKGSERLQGTQSHHHVRSAPRTHAFPPLAQRHSSSGCGARSLWKGHNSKDCHFANFDCGARRHEHEKAKIQRSRRSLFAVAGAPQPHWVLSSKVRSRLRQESVVGWAVGSEPVLMSAGGWRHKDTPKNTLTFSGWADESVAKIFQSENSA